MQLCCQQSLLLHYYSSYRNRKGVDLLFRNKTTKRTLIYLSVCLSVWLCTPWIRMFWSVAHTDEGVSYLPIYHQPTTTLEKNLALTCNRVVVLKTADRHSISSQCRNATQSHSFLLTVLNPPLITLPRGNAKKLIGFCIHTGWVNASGCDVSPQKRCWMLIKCSWRWKRRRA